MKIYTLSEAASALRQAEQMRLRGEIHATITAWHDPTKEPEAVCACGAIGLISGSLDTNGWWSDDKLITPALYWG